MIVVDASALVAILRGEPERDQFLTVLTQRAATLSVIGYWEAAVRAVALFGPEGRGRLDQVLASLGIELAPATARSAETALEASIRFGRKTPADLNLGDCFAYALAKELDAPLLYKGEDFARTDIVSAL